MEVVVCALIALAAVKGLFTLAGVAMDFRPKKRGDG